MVVRSEDLTEHVGGLCNPCGSCAVTTTVHVSAGLCGAALLLAVTVCRWLQYCMTRMVIHMVQLLLWVVALRGN